MKDKNSKQKKTDNKINKKKIFYLPRVRLGVTVIVKIKISNKNYR